MLIDGVKQKMKIFFGMLFCSESIRVIIKERFTGMVFGNQPNLEASYLYVLITLILMTDGWPSQWHWWLMGDLHNDIDDWWVTFTLSLMTDELPWPCHWWLMSDLHPGIDDWWVTLTLSLMIDDWWVTLTKITEPIIKKSILIHLNWRFMAYTCLVWVWKVQ